LMIILGIGSNKTIANKLKDWEYKSNKWLRIAAGFVMIALGLIILVWYITLKSQMF
jgi:uncharacterized membrane protein HdeD (DUF308 family)